MESYAFTTKCAYGFLQVGATKVSFALVQDGTTRGEIRDRPLHPHNFISASEELDPPQDLALDEPLKIINHFLQNYSFAIGAPGSVTKVIKHSAPAGRYHYRQRNNIIKKALSEDETRHLTDEIHAYIAIANTLTEIFYVVEPDTSNLNVFGHQIRNLFIVASTEVENLLKSFFRENGKNSTHMNMEKYVEINKWLRLNKYSVSLRFHKYDQIITPFESWPTTHSLTWYQAYNDTKHNRHAAFDKASLRNLIDAVAAIHILICAQWGNDIFERSENGNFQSIFKNENTPEFNIDYILPPILNMQPYQALSIEYTPEGCFSPACSPEIYPISTVIFTAE